MSERKIRQPIRNGKCKVPVILQMEALECGAASLGMILAYYDKWIPLEQIRLDCGVSRDGSNAKSIFKAAKSYGLDVAAYRYEPDKLKEKGYFPCIIHWNFNHFVVLDGFKGGKAYLNDPAKGAYSVSMDVFDKSFTGICLFFSPGENFVPSGEKKNIWSFILDRLKGSKDAFFFTVFVNVIAALFGLITPAFSRVFIDRLLSQRDPGWLLPFIGIMAGIGLLQVLVSLFQGIYSLRINGKIAAVGSMTYMWKVLHLPLEFFSQRLAGDIQSREGLNANVAKTAVNVLAPLILNVGMMVFYFVVMLRYSPLLTLIGLSSLVVTAVVPYYIAEVSNNYARMSMRDSAKLHASTVAAFDMIETIKASGSENGYFEKWAGYQAAVNTQTIKSTRTQEYLMLLPQFVSSLANQLVLIIGVWLCMNGEFTIGMITAFQGFLTSFMSPAQMLIDSGKTLRELSPSIDRINDVMCYPQENVFADASDEVKSGFPGKMSGRVEVRDLTFGYSRLGEPVIRDFSMKLEPGQSVAIVGGSGCGKSTVSKLLSGLYQPWTGDILFDGRPICSYSSEDFHDSVTVVDQDIILFEDTIENNIKMFDDTVEDYEMILAARDAQIHWSIMQRPQGYQHKFIDGGYDFSGGERQRIEIARALALDPTVIILDEATSALDAKTEYEIVQSIRSRGISSIVIAHRLSTIRSCDEIIVLEKGRIVDRGTHESLMKNCRLYQDLVASE